MTGAEKSTSIRRRIGNIPWYQLHEEIKKDSTMIAYTLKYIVTNNILIDLDLLNDFIYGYSREGE